MEKNIGFLRSQIILKNLLTSIFICEKRIKIQNNKFYIKGDAIMQKYTQEELENIVKDYNNGYGLRPYQLAKKI